MTEVRIRRLKFLGKLTVFIATYFITAKLGLLLAIIQPNATAVWIPTGIAIAALLVLGYSFWPTVFAAAFLVNITTGATTLAPAIGIAIGNTLEAFAAAYLVNRFANGVRAFDNVSDVIEFSFWAGIVAPVISATIGAASLIAFAASLRGRMAYVVAWRSWRRAYHHAGDRALACGREDQPDQDEHR
jgi:integral membrane sensor domain MASE1